jgi:hypothetical protein
MTKGDYTVQSCVVQFPLNVYALRVQLFLLFQRINEYKHIKIIKIIREHELGCICKELSFKNDVYGQIDSFLMIWYMFGVSCKRTVLNTIYFMILCTLQDFK